jgi:hypothetical protein
MYMALWKNTHKFRTPCDWITCDVSISHITFLLLNNDNHQALVIIPNSRRKPLAKTIQCSVTLCQHFRILFWRSFLVRNATWTYGQFTIATELWKETEDDLNDTKHNHRSTSSMIGQPIFQSIHDGVPQEADPSVVEWSAGLQNWPLLSLEPHLP